MIVSKWLGITYYDTSQAVNKTGQFKAVHCHSLKETLLAPVKKGFTGSLNFPHTDDPISFTLR